MIFDVTIVVQSIDKNTTKLLHDYFKEKKSDILFSKDYTESLKIIEKNKPSLFIIELEDVDEEYLKLLKNLIKKYRLIDVIIISEKPQQNICINLLNSGFSFSFIEKPINQIKLDEIIGFLSDRRKNQIQLKTNLDDLFTSYNQLEFIFSILINNLEGYDDYLNNLKDEIENIEINEEYNSIVNQIKQLYFNNKLLITRFNNLRYLDEINPVFFEKVNFTNAVIEVI